MTAGDGSRLGHSPRPRPLRGVRNRADCIFSRTVCLCDDVVEQRSRARREKIRVHCRRRSRLWIRRCRRRQGHPCNTSRASSNNLLVHHGWIQFSSVPLQPDRKRGTESHAHAQRPAGHIPARRLSARRRTDRSGRTGVRSRPEQTLVTSHVARAADPRRSARAAAAARRRRPRTRFGRARRRSPTAGYSNGDGGLTDRRACPKRSPAHRQSHPPGGKHRADGPVRLQRHLLHAVRGRGLPPHHLLPRPPGRDGELHRDAARRQGAVSGAAGQRQPGRAGATCPTVATSPIGSTRIAKPSYLFALVAGRLSP